MTIPGPQTPENPNHGAQPMAQTQPMAHTQPQAQAHAPAPAPAAAGKSDNKLPLFLKISIVLLAALSIASISMLFFGKFEGSFVRIFATFMIFTVFVLLTALDTHIYQRNTWYAPVALIGNAYILAISLIVTWMTDYEPFFLGWIIFWQTVFVIVVTRLVVLCCQLLIGKDDRYPAATGIFALITSIFAVLSGILFTAPIAILAFDVEIPDLYWRFAVAALLLTALGLAITLLLRWQYGAADRERERAQREQLIRAQQAQIAAQYAAGGGWQQAAPYPPAPGVPAAPQPQAQAPQMPQVQQAPLLPWPTFADGRPLPMLPDGQPDFSALNR